MKESGAEMCSRRLYNDFFSALFHDLPEAVTRDIISPVKQATDELPAIVKRIEDEIVKKELVPLMDGFYADEILYFTNDEFANRIVLKEQKGKNEIKKTVHVEWEELNNKYNSDEFEPVDGRTVRLADHLSAFIEAHSSSLYGITSEHLQSGKANILESYPLEKTVNNIQLRKIFNELNS